MDDRILHNPACSKSRGALADQRERRPDNRVVEYLKTPPSVDELAELCRIGGWTAKELVRDSETRRLAELGLSLADDRQDWLQVLHRHPDLLQRPIVLIGGRAVIARPAERVNEILGGP